LFESEAPHGRRRPRQLRSEATVERIKHAMLQIIEREGYSAASTNRIAETAGVNIASLYRYFPNRASIALALYESALLGLSRIVHGWLTANLATAAEPQLHELIELVTDYVDREQVALLRLRNEVPELREGAQAMSLETLAYHPSRVYLEQHLGAMDKATLVRKMYFVQNVGMGMIRQYVLDRPADLPKSQFVKELAGLLVMYLGDAPRPKVRGRSTRAS
jgi:AcrR family transcriptional regulator